MNKKDYPKTKRITIRLNEIEYDLLESYAQKSGETQASYLRKLLINKTPQVKYEIVCNSPRILKIFSDLGHVSGNLNQIARHLNQGGEATDKLQQEVKSCIAQILHMRDEVQEMVGEYRGCCKTHSDS